MSLQEIQKTFFQDPRWAEVEELIMKFVDPLIDMNTIDLTQPAEAVKAEVIGRILAYNNMTEFLKSTRVVSRPFKEMKNPWE